MFSGLQALAGSRENFLRFLYTIILVQFAVIAILLGGLSTEYLSNTNMQAWIATNAPLLGFLLHGEVDALLIGVALGGTVLLIRRRTGPLDDELSDGPVRANPPSPNYIPLPPVQMKTIRDSQAPNQGRPLRKKDPPRERPEDILAELEKQET